MLAFVYILLDMHMLQSLATTGFRLALVSQFL